MGLSKLAVRIGELYQNYRGNTNDLLPLIPQLRAEFPKLPPGREAIETIGLYCDHPRHGGVLRTVSLQSELLVSVGYRVVILAPFPLEDFPFEIPEKCTFLPLGNVDEPSKEDFSLVVHDLERAISDYDIDLIVTHSWWTRFSLFAYIAITSLPVRSVLTCHNFCLYGMVGQANSIFDIRAIASGFDAVTVLSETDLAFWQLAGLPNVHYLPNPLDFNYSIRTDNSAENYVCDLAWIGRLTEATKKISEVLEIFALVLQKRPSSTLHIYSPKAADSPEVLELVALAESLNITDHVRFCPPPNVAAALASAKVFIFTSIVEGFPYVLSEPLLVETPVVMYELPYLEITKANPGIIAVPWGDRQAAADNVLSLLNDVQYRSTIGKVGRQFLQDNFNNDFVLACFQKVVESLNHQRSASINDFSDIEPNIEYGDMTEIVRQLFPLYQAGLNRRMAQLNKKNATINSLKQTLVERRDIIAAKDERIAKLELVVSQQSQRISELTKEPR